MERPSRDDDLVVDHVRVPLHEVSENSAEQSAEKSGERNQVSPDSCCFTDSLVRIRAECVDAAITCRARGFRRGEQVLRILELRDDSVEIDHSSPDSFATSFRSSAIEIVGRNRMKSRKSSMNKPTLPAR